MVETGLYKDVGTTISEFPLLCQLSPILSISFPCDWKSAKSSLKSKIDSASPPWGGVGWSKKAVGRDRLKARHSYFKTCTLSSDADECISAIGDVCFSNKAEKVNS